MRLAPNASHHYTEMGIKDDELAKEKLACPLVGIRQTGFEDGNTIETETDEGHTGTSNLDMGSYRKSAESTPNWEDGCRYGQGFEDYIYMILPDKTITQDSTISAIYHHVYEMPPDVDKDLPLATIYHGFSKTETDARIFNNALLNEFELTLSADDLPKVKPSFISDYNYVNCINPTRHLLEDHLKRTVMANDTSVYIGDVGATVEEMLETPIDCFKEASLTINHNAESQACHGDEFGVNTKTMGARELTGSITMPWLSNDGEELGTKYFETEYEAYNKYGHIVSTEITQKQVMYVLGGANIIRTSTSDTIATGEKIIKTVVTDEGEETEVTTYYIDTGVPYKTIIIVPVVEVTNVTSTKSGDEAKELTFEFKGIEQPTQSYMHVEITTDLAAPHIDTTGCTLATWLPENDATILQNNPQFATD